MSQEANATDERIREAAMRLPRVEPSPEHAAEVRAKLLAAAQAPALRPPSRRVLWASATLLAAAAALLVVRFGMDSTSKSERTAAVPPAPEGPVYRGTIHAHAGAEYIRIGSVPDEIVRLTEGTITVEVATLQPGERFRVVTADGQVEVRGTAFDVIAAGDELRAVRVLHGRVEVRPDQRPMVVLGSDESWTAGEIATADLLVEAPTDLAIPEDPPTPADTSAKTKGKTKTKVTQVVPSPTPIPTPQGDPRPANEILFEEGWAALAAGEPKRAAKAFERAAKAAPDDPMAEDAWFWRGAAQARYGTSSGLTWFLKHYPRSPRVGEASAMLGWLLLDAGDLDGAEARFHAAEDDKVDSVRASAAKGLKAIAKRRE
jgi:hypothetical protein